MQEYKLGGTALHQAVRETNSVELVRLLLERGADVDAKDKVRLAIDVDGNMTYVGVAREVLCQDQSQPALLLNHVVRISLLACMSCYGS